MTDFNRTAMLRRIGEIKELAEAAYWQLLDLRILINKAEVGLTTAEIGSGDAGGGLLGEVESHEDYQPDHSPELDP